MVNETNPVDQVLVIDDDPVMRELLFLLLAQDGYTAQIADSGQAALELLDTLPPSEIPSVVLTDLNMPGLSLAELALTLRTAFASETLLVAMSGSQPAEAALVPFDAFLLKPFTIADFTAALQAARSSAEQAQAAAGSSSSDTNLPVIDESIFNKLSSVMGTAQLAHLYEMFLDDASKRALHMQAATQAADATAFVREAHAIKGGCGMLGARQLHALTGRMEGEGLNSSSLLNDLAPALERVRRILKVQMAESIGGLK